MADIFDFSKKFPTPSRRVVEVSLYNGITQKGCEPLRREDEVKVPSIVRH